MGLPKKEKKYAIDNSMIMERWDYEKNKKLGINPKTITECSHSKANFVCPQCGNNWFGIIRDIIKCNGGCPKCAGNKRRQSWMNTKLSNSERLFITNPELENEWDFEENEKLGLNPEFLVAGSNKKASWVCPLGHKYETRISNRGLKNTGCPFCSGQAILPGFNDLATTRPDLLKEWDYEKNNEIGLTPQNVMKGSHKKASWICPLGHEYKKEIHNRTQGHGCTTCAKESQTSFPEQAIYYYISKIFVDTENRYGKPEIDIFIPSLNFGVEYDGLYAHKNKTESEKKKNRILKFKGINLVRVKEVSEIKPDEKNIIYCKANADYTFLNDVIIKIEKIINEAHNLDINFKPNIKKDRIKIEEQYIFLKKENSISTLYPEIAKEWNYKKNGKIKPEYVSYGSQKKYYWICQNGHEYECSPKERINGAGCQICSGMKYIKNVNDLKTKYPELIKYWDYDLNDVDPSDIKFTNSSKYWWKCDKGHSYQTTIKTMLKYNGCLGCVNDTKILIKGVNDLATLNPKLIEEWDYENNDKTPDCYTLNSNKMVHWICKKCGYHWESNISQRSVCPKCKNNSSIINVYSVDSFDLMYTFNNVKELCDTLNVDYIKQHGNITQICKGIQKTLMNKYILRYNINDEFKDLPIDKRKEIFQYPKTTNVSKKIIVYDIETAKLLFCFNTKKELCDSLKIDLKKQSGNISSICNRRQKSLSKKYILRYFDDDEFKNLSIVDRKKRIDSFLNKR